MGPTLPDLERRLSRRIESRRSIQLSPDDLDLLVATGAYDAFRKAVAEYQRKQCLERSARSRSISGGNTSSTRAKAGTSKSSGTIQSADANEALQQVRAMLGKGGSH